MSPSMRQSILKKTFLATLLLSLSFLVLTGKVYSFYLTDCVNDFEPKTVFEKNDNICITGQAWTKINMYDFVPCADVYIVNNGIWSGGEGLADAMGSENRICNEMMGGFLSALIKPAPLTVGKFDVIMDENADAKFNGDQVFDAGPGWAFEVIDLGHPPVDSSALKSAAYQISQGFTDGIQQWNDTCSALDALGAGLSLMAGDVFGAAVGLAGHFLGVATDYNGAVINQATALIGAFDKNSTPQKASGIYGTAAKHWYDLYEDPPDPNFTVFAPLDFAALNAELAAKSVPGAYPFQVKGTDAREAVLIKVANRSAEQAALVKALRQSYEKYQGAFAVSDYEHAFRQLELTRQYGEWLAGNMNAMKGDLANVKTVFNWYGKADEVYSAAELQALKDRMIATGMTPEEVQSLKDVGFSDTRIQLFIQYVKSIQVPAADFSLSGSIVAMTAALNTAIPAVQTFNSNVLATMNNLLPEFTPHHPMADAGGPYLGTVGSQITLDGNGSSDPDVADALSYAWDLNGDGLFDDGSGVTLLHVWGKPFSGLIGLQVTDSTGNIAISYAQVIISAGNVPPVINSFTPVAKDVSASVITPLVFTVTASDADNDPLSYEWTLDGVSVGNGSSYTLTPGSVDSGAKLVLVTVSDGDVTSVDAVQGRIVKVYAEVDGDGYDSSTDCNDNDFSVNPGATEILGNGKDDDCNPATADILCNGNPPNSYYRDADADGFGNAAQSVQECTAPAGYVLDNSDCNDADAGINPAATEVCNGKDDNCSGQVDEGVTALFYADTDSDGYGNPLAAVQSCLGMAGYVTDHSDCDDTSGAVNPGVTEVMYDGIDNDCNPATLDGIDADNDGYANNVDCNDGDPGINPGRVEIIHNGKDDDCSVVTRDNYARSFVIATDDGGNVYYAKSNGDGAFSNYKNLGVFSSGTSRGVTIEDFNDDGTLDFIAGSSNGSMYLFVNDGADNFISKGVVANHSYGSYVNDMGSGDFNNDGLIDFVANGNSTAINVFINDGAGGFIRTVMTGSGTGRGLDVADFDADGNLDFIRAAYGNNNVWLYQGNGDGTFVATNVGIATGSASDNYALAAADFDNDGKVDVLFGGSSNGNPYFFKGNGDGTFAAPVDVPSLDTNYYNAIDAYDLNDDGNIDIVQSTYNSRSMLFYPGNGDGSFGASVAISTSATTNYNLAIAAPPTGNPAGYPIADAEPKNQSINLGESASLNGTFSFDPDGSIAAYDWKLGDSTTATGATVAHAYLAEGRFSAALTVTDNEGKKDTDVAQVTVFSAPPIADAGGPYTFGESFASNGVYTVPLDGTGSTDDFGIDRYAWDFPSLLQDSFTGTTLNSSKWLASTGVSQNGSATITGVNGWGSRYLFSRGAFGRTEGLTFEFRVKPGTVSYQHAMFGVKNTSTDYSYGQMPHAFYFNQGSMLIYEDGSNRGTFATYTRGVQYDLKLVLKATGALYYMRETGQPDWQLIYTSNYSSLATLKFGGTIYSDSFEVDDVIASQVVFGATPNVILPQGTFSVTLTVTDKAGQQASDATTINTVVGAPPVADAGGPYVADETVANQNRWTVTLDGSGSTDDVAIETYTWDFGDGTSGTGVSPTHLYTGAGNYNVTLTVTDRGGQSDIKTTTVTTQGAAYPQADPGGPYLVAEDLVVNKHWSIAVDADGSSDDYGIWKYSWNFGDGSAAVTTPQATHEYATPGTYNISLTVTDHANQAHVATTIASVTATAAPTASAGGPYFTEPNTPVKLDGTASTDNTGILSYLWDFGDGTTGKGVKPSHTYSSSGLYVVSLTVTDTALQTATAGTTVDVAVGDPPVANAGGSYSSNTGVPVRLNGSASTDDFGILTYLWKIGSPSILFQDDFAGTVIDPGKWLFPAAGVTQNDAVTITASGGWGTRYLFSKNDFSVNGAERVTGQIRQVGGGYMMFGFKDTSTTNFSYTQMPYALYFYNGNFYIYESGSSRGSVGSYVFNTLYDVKIELKQSSTGNLAGATYSYKPAADANWVLLYDSNYVPASASFKVGATTYSSGTFTVDNIVVSSGLLIELGGEKPVLTAGYAGSYPVELTVTDGTGQTSTASSTLTVSSDPLVITAPWQFSGGIEIPHDTWSGEEVILKAVVKSGTVPLTYVWDFGDGTSSDPVTVTNSYNLSAKHTYTAGDGTPISARITVTDADGRTSSDLFPIIVRTKSLNVEVNKTIDDALWYIHTQQNRSNGSWQSSGYSNGYYSSPTASAIHAMQINGHLEVGDFSNDPYVEDVWQGMKYLLTTLNTQPISDQAYGDPDVNGNGSGIQVNSGSRIYETGQAMMALVASGTPAMVATNGGTGIVGRSYRDIVEDMAEMYYWGQVDSGGAAGGWQYSWNSGADNSASQWAALGFEAAEEQGWINVPQWVRDRNIVWLANSNSANGIGYGYSGRGNGEATSPSGLAQVAFNGIPTSDPRWKLTENDLAARWNSWYNGSGNYYALYAMAKAMRTAKPLEITIMGEGTANAIDWYNDETRGVARTIINQQNADGLFTGGGGTHWVEGSFRTAWGVIILTKTLFVLPPVADAGDNKVWGVDWELIFDGAKSFHLDPFRQIVQYEWDFDGDGVYDFSSDQPTATHIYTELGTYQAKLRVTDNNDPAKVATDTVTIIVAVPPHPPVAAPGGPYIGYVGVPLQLDGSASYDIDPTDIITTYGWEVDGVYPYNFGDASGAKPQVTLDSPGTYNIGLQVFDNGVLSPNNDKLSDIKWTTVIIQANNPPLADAGGPYTVNEGGSITLNAAGSSDPDGNQLSYGWDLDNDGTFETSGISADFSRPDNGSFTVGLRISDGALEAVTTTTVTVENVDPVVSPLPAATFNESGSYTASGFFTDPGADSWTATVDYGDGSGSQPLALNPDNTFALSHVYSQNGDYSVTVTVMDDDAGSGAATAAATVLNVPPTVNAGPDATLVVSRSFASAGAFADPGADSWSATVDYGDGSGNQPLTLNPDKTFALAHEYSSNGSFTVTVTVNDADGGSGSDTADVHINNQAPEVNAGPDANIYEADTFNSSGSFTDPGSSSWTATVDYGDGSATQALPLTGNAFDLSHVYSQDGSYTVTVTVTDNEAGTGSNTALVTVNNVAPTVDAGPDATIDAGSSFNSAGSFTDPGADVWTATVNFDDGTGDQPLALNGDKTFTLTHVYATPGNYSVTVTVNDGADSGSDTAVVTVNALVTEPEQTIDNLTVRTKLNKADLVWSCVPGDVTYNIYRSTSAGGPYSQLAMGHSSSYCTYADFGLVIGTRYYWRVTSVDASGMESLYSNEVTAVPSRR